MAHIIIIKYNSKKIERKENAISSFRDSFSIFLLCQSGAKAVVEHQMVKKVPKKHFAKVPSQPEQNVSMNRKEC